LVRSRLPGEGGEPRRLHLDLSADAETGVAAVFNLEHRPNIQLLDGRANGSDGRCKDWRVAQMRMKLFLGGLHRQYGRV